MPKGRRRTDRELFIDSLKELAGGADKLVSNIALRTKLGWSEEKYNRVWDELWQEGVLTRGRGRGGSVGIKPTAIQQKIKLFLSYSHKDIAIAERLLQHLEPLRRMGILESWNFRELKPGDEWDKKIKTELSQSEVIVMLISVDFINSSYISDIEVETALGKHRDNSAVIIPVLARNCLWKTSPLGELQALPQGLKAMISWTDLDDACVDVVNGIRTIVEERLAAKKAA
ncbi:toll/interleukin-1 receptor domain-containing protein [Devosia sp. A16]|uniref:toll/interleukin-1 receptor domain-containing protein n=1 Tax=Devosia sp. A16 TaxID=1736675 RepID=UPI0018D1493E|nr:toll/interleukin-1 receptor domain-containing protein [Devosia sp. A16]